MKATKEKVNIYKNNVIYLMEDVGWYLVEDRGRISNSGNGLCWVTCLTFKKGGKERVIHYMGTTRDTLNYFRGAYKALTYAVDF